MASYSRLDTIYRKILLSRFFTKGWGRPDHLKRIFELRRQLGKRELAVTYVDSSMADKFTITKDENKGDFRQITGFFRTPFMDYLPELLPPESEKAHFQM